MPEEITTLNSLSIRSEEVQEIIGRPPNWIVRWGITVFFIILLIVVALSWFIQYPDIVTASFRLTSINAPKSVIAHADGQLIKLFIKDHDQVHQGQILGFIESTSDPEEVLGLSRMADTLSAMINADQTEGIQLFARKHFTNLGSLQTDFQTFNQSLLQFKAYLSSGYYQEKKDILTKDLDNLKHLEDNLLQQKEIATRDFQLSQQSYHIQETLAVTKVIAPLEFKQEESKFLNKKLPLTQLNASIISNKSSQNELEDQLLELKKNISEQKITFLQAINTLQSAISAWKYRYLLMAPVDGHVSFTSLLQENQIVENGDQLFYITPKNTGYMGTMLISQFNMGKIKQGERVLIKFAGYPFEEYGSVNGRISAISNVPLDSGYLVKVFLPEQLKTNYNKELAYREGMSGSGEIITENRRLIENFFYNIRKALGSR
ncbi:HlyD family secretion protein [Compostibacter hankyongensis]|uniref:HlyD family efflux transporter periplasmic adaptor subunit n=1 Tax=Compostibacter hankyongensis TaxID=1007089 RepID=A0ABP8FSD0_9BACT